MKMAGAFFACPIFKMLTLKKCYAKNILILSDSVAGENREGVILQGIMQDMSTNEDND